MVKDRIRVRLKSYDHRLIDEASAKIIETVIISGAQVIGPVPLPTSRKMFVVTTSPHTDKNARDHFETLVHRRLVDILKTNARVIDSLQHLELPAGVQVEIKM